MTSAQLKLLNIARRQVERVSAGTFDEAGWRIALVNIGKVRPNVAGRPSSKNLTDSGFDSMMALLESLGFRDQRGEGIWTAKLSHKTGLLTPRQLWLIHDLYRRYAAITTDAPALGGIVRRATYNTHDQPDKLPPRLAHNVIEALKKMLDRDKVDTEPEEPAEVSSG